MKPVVSGLAAAFGGLVVLGALPLASQAQQQPQAQQLDRIEITGTNIRRTDTETVSPVVVITRRDIQESGAVTIADVLARLPIAGAAVDDRLANGFTPGAGNVDLRGIGPQNTLILLNGRRVGPYAFGNRSASTQIFQDVYALPINDVERIEILKDGASAIYGADAVGGVVNFITRRDFTGLQVGARAGVTQEGDGEVFGVDFAAGFGELGKDRYNLYATVSYTRESDVKTVDRSFASNEDLRARGGPDFRSSFAAPGTWINLASGATVRTDPNCPFRAGFCRENRASNPNVTLQPESDRISGFSRLTFEVTPQLQAFGELLAMRNEATQGGFGAAADRYRDPTTGAPVINNYILIPGAYPGNPIGANAGLRWRFDDVGGQNTEVTSDRFRILGGLKGSFGAGWDWEGGVYYDKGEVDSKQFNQVTIDTLAPVIASGAYSFTGVNSPDVLNRLRYNSVRTGESTLTGADVRVSGEVGRLPAGPIGVAFGYNYINTEMRDTPDPASAGSRVLGTSASAGFGEQSVNAVFAEVNVPMLKNVEGVGALRYDKYSGNGDFSRTSPKLGVKWTPTKELLLRTTWSKAFRAPSVYETSSASQTSFEFGLEDPVTCIAPTDPGCSIDVRVLETGNANLKPEKSDVWNVGFVFEPKPGISFEVDYFNIQREDEITSYDNQVLLTLFGTDPSVVLRDPVTRLPTTLINSYRNVNESKVAGWDLGVRTRTPIEGWGAVRFTGLLTYYTTWEQETLGVSASGGPEVTSTNFLSTYGLPRMRAATALSWDYGAWSTTVRNDFVKGQSFQIVAGEGQSESYWGLNVNYNISRVWSVTLDIANLLDRNPSFMDDSRGAYAGFSPYFGDPYGRRFLLNTRYTFR